ncbi:MAG: hypothetical protein D6741_08365 [Planctomycetota bacterium]|nr:MAG: hypothetical protein D6741_08365 [Planctomycetota bacterium]
MVRPIAFLGDRSPGSRVGLHDAAVKDTPISFLRLLAISFSTGATAGFLPESETPKAEPQNSQASRSRNNDTEGTPVPGSY